MIQPTISRQVWFWRDQRSDAQPEAATIAYVHNNWLVNLQVIDHNGNARSETSVHLYQGDNDVPAPNGKFCEWMPYQKGQAARTEQLEKQLGGVS
jgi:hypothetical protein